MSDIQDLRVEPVAPAAAVEPVQPARKAHAPAQPAPGPDSKHEPAAVSTIAQLGTAYAQFLVDPDSQDVVLKIRDAATNEVLNEIPSPAVQALDKHLREYAELLARRRAATAATPKLP
jgi:hypothetical protein